ncbi:MAG TPA: manganese efflux pump [Candidatus Dormibacteraeota bacterium]|nr:manganese efflux pump [Candidatus Dormibacteraeota bacterium]
MRNSVLKLSTRRISSTLKLFWSITAVNTYLTLAAILLPLSFDTFAVSAALGAAGLAGRDRLRVSLLMMGFEVGMPVVGLFLGRLAGGFIGDGADYVAIAMLAGLGIWILRPGGDAGEEHKLASLGQATWLAATGMGLSISLDELAMGASLGLLHLPVVPALVLIGIQALVASQLGLRLGSRISERGRERSEKAAGVSLLLLAAFLLAVHLR